MLAHIAHGIAQLVFGTGHGLVALSGRCIELQTGVVAHGAAQLQLHFHIGHTVTQGLECGNGGVELLAGVHVLHGDGHGFVHHADAFSAHTRNANVHGMAQCGLTVEREQTCRTLIELEFCGAATVLGAVARCGTAFGSFGHQEQSQFARGHRGHQKGIGLITHGYHAFGACHKPLTLLLLCLRIAFLGVVA